VSDLFDAVKVIGFSIIGLAVIVIVLGSIFGLGIMTAQETNSGAFAISSGTATLTGYNVTDPTVNQSLGHAARLDGTQDSYVSGSSDVELEGNWTVSTYVRVDNLTQTQTVVSVGSEQMILYNGSTNEYVGVWFDSDTGETYAVREAANTPGDLTHVALVRNQSQPEAISLIENNSDVATTSTATATTFAAGNLDGDLDETRTFNRSLDSSERQQLVDRPTAPLPGTERTSRVMFDSYSASPTSYPAFFVGGSVSAANVQRVDGLEEEATVAGTDYTRTGRTISALQGGSLDGAPAVYVSYTAEFGPFVGLLNALQTTGGAALGLLVTGLLLFAGTRVIDLFDDGY
jgi:hypothetical protein